MPALRGVVAVAVDDLALGGAEQPPAEAVVPARDRFALASRPEGFPNEGAQTDVVENGAYFDRRWLPTIGYQPVLELRDPETREGLGLDPAAPRPNADDADE